MEKALAASKKLRSSQLTERDFYDIAKEMQNRHSSERAYTNAQEDRLFREFFGVSAFVALTLYTMLVEYNFLPPGGEIIHLLWTLFFLKKYPTEGVSSAAAGGSRGKVDPKTFRKWVWLFVSAIVELYPFVVSCVQNFVKQQHFLSHICAGRFYLRTGS
jgi:hypothetical protein